MVYGIVDDKSKSSGLEDEPKSQDGSFAIMGLG